MINALIISEKNKYVKNLVDFLSNNEFQSEVLLGHVPELSIDLINNFDVILIDLDIKKTNGFAILSKILRKSLSPTLSDFFINKQK